MSRMIQLLLVLFLTGILAACGGESADSTAKESDASGSGETTAQAAPEAPPEEDSSPEPAPAPSAMVEEAADVSGTVSESMAEAVAPDGDGGSCDLTIEVGDNLAYSTDSLSVPSSCETVTLTMTHTGKLPKKAMGHNWVLVPTDAVQQIGMAATNAGIENDYVPDDERIVVATELIGGGERSSVTFSLSGLDPNTDYSYVCTFPGHWSVMRGSFRIE